MNILAKEALSALDELLERAHLKEGQILVVGCSSSEIVGGVLGHASNPEAAKEVFDAIYAHLCERGIFLAAQCCEHLNRALVVEEACAEKYGLEPVTVVPKPKAGGSFASAAYRSFRHPVALEHICADAGLDIGGTLIGMHLRKVAVPVRLAQDHIGSAMVLAARTRPKFIGGERAVYDESLKGGYPEL